MENTHDPHVARGETAFLCLLFAVFACAAQLVNDPRLNTENRDDGGMGMVYYERYEPFPHCTQKSGVHSMTDFWLL